MKGHTRVKLKSHQIRAIEQFTLSSKGMILYHSVGSGKTITSIYCSNEYPNVIPIFVTPNSIKEQFHAEIRKYINPSLKSYKIYTYNKFIDLLESKSIPKNRLIILDEAHRLRNPNTRGSRYILKYCNKYAFKTLFLTGTLFVNFPWDISPLINTLKLQDEYNLPVTEDRFKKTYYSADRLSPYSTRFVNSMDFFSKIEGLVSIHKADITNFPVVQTVSKPVTMSLSQENLHKKIVSRTIEKQNIKRLGIDKDEAKSIKNLNSFLAQTRQISNVVKGENKYTPKIISVIDQIIKENTFPVVVYSNFLEAGVFPAQQYLRAKYRTISNDVISGSLSIAQKQEIIDDYNLKKLKVLFITSSASEGVDLKRTRQIHIMEPHWNFPKIEQVIGRGVRYRSHINLPNKDRNVTVYKWFSVYASKQGYTADQYLIDMSIKKKHFNDFFDHLLSNEPQPENIQFLDNSPLNSNNNNMVRRTKAATKIQSYARARIAKKTARKTKAATKIQSYARGHIARKNVKSIVKQSKMKKHNKSAPKEELRRSARSPQPTRKWET